MAIKIIDTEPDVHLTKDELARFRAEYDRTYMFYSGTPPCFEAYCRNRKRREIEKEPGK